MQSLSRLRFNALAGYSRQPPFLFENQELEWFKFNDERVLAALVRHYEDGDFAGVILGRDRLNRYRAIKMIPYVEKLSDARKLVRRAVVEQSNLTDSEFYQGDEVGVPMNFFNPAVPEQRLHSHFKILHEHRYNPALGIIRAMMHYFRDPDGNFVEQFQTTGFDARLWELYLFCALTEELCAFDRDSFNAPDFLCERFTGKFFVEAVTVNPTFDRLGNNLERGMPTDPAEQQRYLQHYVPIKYGSPLFSKLGKKYWELPHVTGFPIVFAIQDFHYPGSMVWSEGQLSRYLYGLEQTPSYNSDGELIIESRAITEHRWNDKVIPSGFFKLTDSDNVSAVITNSQATLSKFNRMGIKAGFGDRSVKGVRTVSAFNPDPNASHSVIVQFDIHDHQYQETWCEGINVYHNPNARIPLPNEFLEQAVHHRLVGDQISSYGPEWRVLSSVTQYGVTLRDIKRAKRRTLNDITPPN